MTHRNTSLIRIVQKYSQKIREKVRFKTAHITQGGKIALLGSTLCLISLVFPWISILDSSLSFGGNPPSTWSFSSLLGGVGFFICITLLVIIFSIFSIQKKEKLRFISMIQLSDQLSAHFGSILILILSLQSFLFISGLRFFSLHISYEKGIILCITGGIILLIGSLIMKKEYRKNIKGSYISNIDPSPEKFIPQVQKDNMKFPF